VLTVVYVEAVRRNSRTHKAGEAEIELVIKNWLKKAPNRCVAAAPPCKSPSLPSRQLHSSEEENDDAGTHDQIGELLQSCAKCIRTDADDTTELVSHERFSL